MAIRYPATSARPASRQPNDQRQQRRAVERQRRAEFARMNVAIAQKLRS